MSDPYDTMFSLPSVDDDPDTEIGVLLMGLGPERLLAGLGVACREPAADAATVTMLVDQLRHGVRTDTTFEEALAAGVARWRLACVAIAAADLELGHRSAGLRALWRSAATALAAGATTDRRLSTASAAERVYLTACWLRPEEITTMTEEHGVLPELPS